MFNELEMYTKNILKWMKEMRIFLLQMNDILNLN